MKIRYVETVVNIDFIFIMLCHDFNVVFALIIVCNMCKNWCLLLFLPCSLSFYYISLLNNILKESGISPFHLDIPFTYLFRKLCPSFPKKGNKQTNNIICQQIQNIGTLQAAISKKFDRFQFYLSPPHTHTHAPYMPTIHDQCIQAVIQDRDSCIWRIKDI